MKKLPSKINQQGVVIVFTAISLLAILGMAGLAIDLGHSYTIKTRLQNSIDAAALSAATAIYKQVAAAPPGSTVNVNPSIQKALGTFKSNVLGANFWGVQTNTSNISASFCVSSSLQDFSSCLNLSSIPAPTAGSPNINFFVRATAINTNNANSPAIDLRPFIIQVLGINQKAVGASAVAGLRAVTTGEKCNLLPMFVCNNSPSSPSTDYDCSNGTCFGNQVGKSYYLKASSKCPAGSGNSECPASPIAGAPTDPITDISQVEPIANFDGVGTNTTGGEFMLASILNSDGATYDTGANALRNAVVNPLSCTGNTIKVAQGNESDMAQPFNAIFGATPIGSLGSDLDPDSYQDLVTTSASDPYYIKIQGSTTTLLGTTSRTTFADYNAVYTSNSYPITPAYPPFDQSYRRVITIPVVNCGTSVSPNQILDVKGYACFFLPENIPGGGAANFLIGELIKQEHCALTTGSVNPGSAIEIVLYDDYLNNDE